MSGFTATIMGQRITLLLIVLCSSTLAAENPLIFTTNECYLTEPVYEHKFDFSALRSDFAHLTTSDTGDIFEFNICGNLSRTCAGRTDTAACLKRSNDKEYVLGTQHQLNYRNGKMYFSFTNGEKCTNGKEDEKYQLHVFLGCDYTLDKNQSRVTSYSGDACSFYITFETPLACLPEPDLTKTNNCSVRDPHSGHIYDLLPLSDANYKTSDRQGNVFVINVCKPVLYAENAMCPPGSSICFADLKSTDFKQKFFDYGSAQANPIIENGQLLMYHTSPTPCNSSANYSATVQFYCDKDVKNAHPELVGKHGCIYQFSFVTPLACNDLAPCTAITRSNEIFDMSPLKDKSFTLQSHQGNYTFAVCSHAGAPCLEQDGACRTLDNQSTSLGQSNAHLRINQTGVPYLLYENGAPCVAAAAGASNVSHGKSFWSTKIEFVCANGNNTTKRGDTAATTAVLGPKIIEDSNCRLLIHYQTELACREQITCKAKVYVEHSEDGTGMDVVDLTPLISTTENYEAQIDASLLVDEVSRKTKFFLNVCRPLVPTYGLGCPGGSAACMATVDSGTDKPEEEQSLGFSLNSLVAINRTSAELRYLLGGPCPTDSNTQLSSRIEFSCDRRAGRGAPVLHEISDCHYRFHWATNVICPPHMCNFNENTCEISNDEINATYNLRRAPFAKDGTITIRKDKSEFTLDLCNSHHKAVTDYSQSLVNLFFTTKTALCSGDGVVNVQMRLICSNITEHATSFSDDSQCNLVYIQRTPDICEFLGLTKAAHSTSTTTTAPTSSTESNGLQILTEGNRLGHHTTSVGTILGAILTLTFFVACIGLFAFSPARRRTVRRLFRRRTSAVRYSRVQSSEEANLLLEPNGEFTESDDDDMLL